MTEKFFANMPKDSTKGSSRKANLDSQIFKSIDNAFQAKRDNDNDIEDIR